MHVVAGDVLHRARPALDETPVAGHDLHLDDRVPHRAHAELADRRGAGGDHPAHRRIAGGVDRPLLAALGEHRGEVVDPHPRLDHAEHLGGVVRDPIVEQCRPQLGVDLAHVALVDVLSPADDQHACPRGAGGAERVDDAPFRMWVDQIHVPTGSAPFRPSAAAA